MPLEQNFRRPHQPENDVVVFQGWQKLFYSFCQKNFGFITSSIKLDTETNFKFLHFVDFSQSGIFSLLLSFQVFLLKAKARRPLIITPTITTMLTTNMLMRPTNKKRSSIKTQSSFPRPPACSSTRGRQSSYHAWLTNWVSYSKPSENFVATTLIIYRLHYVGEMK